MPHTHPTITRLTCLLVALFILGCGGAPVQPDDSREKMEDRRDKAFKEL